MPKYIRDLFKKVDFMVHELQTDKCYCYFKDETKERIDLDEISNRLLTFDTIGVEYIPKGVLGKFEYVKYTNGGGVGECIGKRSDYVKVSYISDVSVNSISVFPNNSLPGISVWAEETPNGLNLVKKDPTGYYLFESLGEAPALFRPKGFNVSIKKEGVEVPATVDVYEYSGSVWNIDISDIIGDFDEIEIRPILNNLLSRKTRFEADGVEGVCDEVMGGIYVAPGENDVKEGAVIYSGYYMGSPVMPVRYIVANSGEVFLTDAGGVAHLVEGVSCDATPDPEPEPEPETVTIPFEILMEFNSQGEYEFLGSESGGLANGASSRFSEFTAIAGETVYATARAHFSNPNDFKTRIVVKKNGVTIMDFEKENDSNEREFVVEKGANYEIVITFTQI